MIFLDVNSYYREEFQNFKRFFGIIEALSFVKSMFENKKKKKLSALTLDIV